MRVPIWAASAISELQRLFEFAETASLEFPETAPSAVVRDPSTLDVQ
jgi:hypothetical protein